MCLRDGLDQEGAAQLLKATDELWALHGYPETGGCNSARRVNQPFDVRLVGQPLDGVQLLVLDRRLNAPPIGAMGELYACRHRVTPDAAGGRSFSAAAMAEALLSYPEVADVALMAGSGTGGLRLFVKWQPGLDPQAAFWPTRYAGVPVPGANDARVGPPAAQ